MDFPDSDCKGWDLPEAAVAGPCYARVHHVDNARGVDGGTCADRDDRDDNKVKD